QASKVAETWVCDFASRPKSTDANALCKTCGALIVRTRETSHRAAYDRDAVAQNALRGLTGGYLGLLRGVRAVGGDWRPVSLLGTYRWFGAPRHAHLGPGPVRARRLPLRQRPDTLRRRLGEDARPGRALLGNLGVAALGTRQTADVAPVLRFWR